MKELVERMMFSLNSGSESSRSEDSVGHETETAEPTCGVSR